MFRYPTEAYMGKNWSGICAVENTCLRMALAQIAADSDTGMQLAVAFPGCFNEGEDEGTIPLSFIVQKAWEIGRGDFDIDQALIDLHVPYVRYALTKAQLDLYPGILVGLFSDEYQAANDLSFGETVSLEGADYVVVQHFDGEVALVPIERVFPDTKNNRAAIAA